MLIFRYTCEINKVLNQYRNNKHSVKRAVNLLKKSVYIKLRLTLQTLATVRIGECLLTAKSTNLSDVTIWRVTVNLESYR